MSRPLSAPPEPSKLARKDASSHEAAAYAARVVAPVGQLCCLAGAAIV
jgi:hypothetical protein